MIQVKNIKGNWSGAMSGTWSLGQEAEQILVGADYGSLMAYMFRRFGMPYQDSDDHKEMCNYFLSTKIKGAYLNVSPRASGITHSFGYILDGELGKKVREEESFEYNQKQQKFKEWMAANCKESIVMMNDYSQKDEDLQPAVTSWYEKFPEYKLADDTVAETREEVIEAFWKYQEQRFDEEYKKFNSTYPEELNPKYNMEKHRYDFPVDSLRQKINDAYLEAIKELLHPVYIRDVPINACGLYDGKLSGRNYSKEAGSGLISLIKEAKSKKK